tara:strand:+ start:5651 stop:6544 length:894 start_codon:yes stop_codon:yes gene_type:complete
VKEKILITGFNGHIARKLNNFLDKNKYELNYLTTKKNECSTNVFYWDIQKHYIDPYALQDTKHIIHLAGFNISNRWSKNNKKVMFDSRIKSSQLLYNQCNKIKIKPETFISASAMGYYGFNQTGLKDENTKHGNDWMSNLCVNWESMADQFEKIGTRVCKLRFSLIIDEKSEIMKKINLGFKFRFGLIFGSGQQHFPWIHSNDICRFIQHIIQKNDIKGVFNIATPQNTSYLEFIKSIQLIRHPKSILIYVPKIIFDYIMPQKKNLLFNDIKLCVNKMKSTGFNWKYKTIEDVIKKK